MKNTFPTPLKSNDEYIGVLKEIAEGRGRYNMDKLAHASNTIDDMKELAKQALKNKDETNNTIPEVT